MLKDLDSGLKSFVTDQEWVEKPTTLSQQPSAMPPSAAPSAPPSVGNALPPLSQKRARSDELASSTLLLPTDHVRVLSHKKRDKDFANLFRWQTLRAHTGAIRVMEFNRCAKYLATAGEDALIKLWELDPRLEENRLRRSGIAYIKRNTPGVVFQGHMSDVTAISWSKNDFLLSGSADRTVRLWHPRTKHAIRTLIHGAIVTCVAFHPLDEQICISGAADGSLTMWHIKERKILSQTKTYDLITACLITPDGAWAMVGNYYGRCMFYAMYDEILGEWQFKHTTQIDVRSRRAKHAQGKKICGFRWYGTRTDKVLVSSNDSRLRLYRLDDKSVLSKYFGHTNTESHLNGSFSPYGKYVLCASENRSVYIWEVDEMISSAGDSKRQNIADGGVNMRDGGAYETFVVKETGSVTGAVFAPKLVPKEQLRQRGGGLCRSSGIVIVVCGGEGDLRVFGCC